MVDQLAQKRAHLVVEVMEEEVRSQKVCAQRCLMAWCWVHFGGDGQLRPKRWRWPPEWWHFAATPAVVAQHSALRRA